MKINKHTVVLFASLFFVSAALRAQSVLVKGYAFAQKANYGREMKDLEGNTVERPDSLYTVYLELKGKTKPQLTVVRYNGRRFAADVVAVPERRVTAGKLKSTGKPVVLQAQKTTTLWRIVVTPDTDAAVGKTAKGLSVAGRANGRAFVFSAPRWTVLQEDILP